jgi:hypothetical protein
MYTLESGESPSLTLYWKPFGFLNHIYRRTNGDRFPLSLWEVWFCSTLGAPIPTLIGPSQRGTCNVFHYDSFGDHLETCQVKSMSSQIHDWVVYRLGVILGSVGHKVKIHKIIFCRFHFDSYTLWKITCAFYWTAHEYKEFGWCS